MLINFHRSKIRDACCLDLAQLSLASGGGGGGGGSLKWASPQDVTDHQGWKRQKLHEKVLQANKTALKNYIVARVLRLLATKKLRMHGFLVSTTSSATWAVNALLWGEDYIVATQSELFST